MPEGLRLRRRGRLQFAFNFSGQAQALPFTPESDCLIGGPVLAPAGVAAWPCA
ncbi:Beta-galactosidase C-terminal domain [Ideonella sp.]|uniref:Beta-galactosidase C-terminal domain n=1 Tax=Ideonella sp. TaxID=1929293 RepID=UPI003BB58836